MGKRNRGNDLFVGHGYTDCNVHQIYRVYENVSYSR